jgi:hypothetical protein
MRIAELTRMPHLFLDMDGVQADFFGAWAHMHQVPTYKHIPKPEEAIDALAASGPDKVYEFFVNLKPLPGGRRIVNWLNENLVPFTVLSAPLRGAHSTASIEAKRDWLDRHNPGTSQYAIFTSAKEKFALKNGHPQVLVDDFGKYLIKWDQAGGVAVKHDEATTHHTLAQLEKIYGKR